MIRRDVSQFYFVFFSLYTNTLMLKTLFFPVLGYIFAFIFFYGETVLPSFVLINLELVIYLLAIEWLFSLSLKSGM